MPLITGGPLSRHSGRRQDTAVHHWRASSGFGGHTTSCSLWSPGYFCWTIRDFSYGSKKKKRVPVREFWLLACQMVRWVVPGSLAAVVVKVILQMVVLKRRSSSWELRIIVSWAMGLDVPAWPAVLEKSWHQLAIAIVSFSRLWGLALLSCLLSGVHRVGLQDPSQ